jgi:hypothetical protein
MPEFLVNGNGVHFGETGKEGVIGDVILPPWASTPEEFISKHRAALESEYVSAHLNEWIDLIFGYKQRGEEAVKAHNTFYWLTYPGMVDIDSITDPVERRSTEAQALNFGVCPSQLFTKAHPKRLSLEQVRRSKNFFNSRSGSFMGLMSSAFQLVLEPLRFVFTSYLCVLLRVWITWN